MSADCVPNIIGLGVCYKKIAPLKSWCVCLIQRQNSRYFRCLVWKTKS